jgi:hypothetical protein
MNNNVVTEKIQRLQEEIIKYETLSKEFRKIELEQQRILDDSLDRYKPLMKWYKEANVKFLHPVLSVQSYKGPILGCDTNEDKIIVYDYENRKTVKIKKTYPHDVEDYPRYKLISDGFFVDAISGLKYVEYGYAEGTKNLRELIDTGKQRLDQVKL